MRQRPNQRGTTLLEQLISLLLGSTVIVGLYGFYRAQLYQTLAQETKTAAVQDGRGALDIIVRDLKNAGSWGAGPAALETGSTGDPDGDADTVCNQIGRASCR